MKRLFLTAALALVLAGAFAAADEETEVYRQIYQQADGISQKYAAIVNLTGLNDPASAPVLADALRDLLATQRSYSSPSDQEILGRAIRALASSLGTYKYREAAPLLWSAVQNISDPLARSESLMAIGAVRDLDYAERIALLLRNLDIAPGSDRDADEKVAYGCIVALQKLKDARGYMAVFYATDAWYTQRTRQLAVTALPSITDDPSDSLAEIIRNETPERKLLALKENSLSRAAADRKAATALLALSVGLGYSPRNPAEKGAMGDLKKGALRQLIALKGQGGAEAAKTEAQSYLAGYDDEEKLLALQALGSNGSDEAADQLRDIILALDKDVRSGISDEGRNRMAKAAIENAGATKNKIVKLALLTVSSDDRWSNGVILAAKNALKGID